MINDSKPYKDKPITKRETECIDHVQWVRSSQHEKTCGNTKLSDSKTIAAEEGVG